MVLVLRSAWTPNWRRSCSTWTLPPATVHQYQHRLEPTYDKDDVLLLLLVVLSTQYQLDPDDPDILTNIVCVTSTRNTSTAVQYQTCATPSWILYSRLTVLEWYYIVPAGRHLVIPWSFVLFGAQMQEQLPLHVTCTVPCTSTLFSSRSSYLGLLKRCAAQLGVPGIVLSLPGYWLRYRFHMRAWLMAMNYSEYELLVPEVWSTVLYL